jgi:D-alanine--D-alanine ligase (EC 6.3.2.4)
MKVGVLMGGTSSEREISLLTGKEISKALNRDKYEVIELDIKSEKELINKLEGIDFALLALHGSFGEDGKVQAVLESMKIPYSGSGVLASALCMDKNLSKKLFKAEDIPTAGWSVVKSPHYDSNRLSPWYPVVVKPNSGGSSVATFIVHSEEELKIAILEALKYDSEVMIEEYVDGMEITCSMLDGKLLPILSIKPKDDFFNYSSKYENGGAEEVIINLPEKLRSKVEEICLKCWSVFKLKTYARIDMIIKKDEIYVLEINTLPGMTANSLLPKSAKAYGLSFPELLDKIIELSLSQTQ